MGVLKRLQIKVSGDLVERRIHNNYIGKKMIRNSPVLSTYTSSNSHSSKPYPPKIIIWFPNNTALCRKRGEIKSPANLDVTLVHCQVAIKETI
jgi:hypothetical protein